MRFLRNLAITCIFLLIVLTSAQLHLADAAKKRVGTKQGSTPLSFSSAKLSRSTNSVVVTFKKLANVSKISYELTYTSKGKEEGAGGVLTPATSIGESRTLYFGTCSHAVCTPHTSIRNATLLVVTTLKSGARNTKRYIMKL